MTYFDLFLPFLECSRVSAAVILRIWSWFDRSDHGWSLSVVPGVQFTGQVKLRYHLHTDSWGWCLGTFKHIQPTRIWPWPDGKPAALLPPRWGWVSFGIHSCGMGACSPSVNCSRSRSSSHSLIWSVIVGGRNGVWEGPNTRYYRHNVNLLSLWWNIDGSRVSPDLSEHDRMSPGPQEVDNLAGKRPLLPSGGWMLATLMSLSLTPQVRDNLGSFSLSYT